MLTEMGQRIRQVDTDLRARNARLAAEQLAARRQALADAVMAQMSANPTSAFKAMDPYLNRGVGAGEKTAFTADDLNEMRRNPRSFRTQTAVNTYADMAAVNNPAYRMHTALAGEGIGDRAQQVAAYGGMVGGGLAALTASGQGLMQLTAYIQEGQRTQAMREQEMLG